MKSKDLQDFLSLLLQKYNYISISNIELNSVVEECFKKEKMTPEEYKRTGKKILEKLIKDKINNESYKYDILNTFIEFNILPTKNPKKALIELKKISEVFLKFNLSVDFKTCENLVNNEKISSLLDVVKKSEILTDDEIIKNFLEFCSIEKIDLVTSDYEMIQKSQNGNLEARNKLIEDNLGLIKKIAHIYENRGLEYEELIHEGCLGMIRGIEKFDISKGYRFSTYITYWIKEAMQRALETKVQAIRLPSNVYNKMVKYNVIKTELDKKSMQDVTVEQIAKNMNISVKEAGALYNYQRPLVSLEQTISEESNETTVASFISDPNACVEKEVANKEMKKLLLKLIKEKITNTRDIQILFYRFGFYNGKCMTLDQISAMYGVSRERVRQIIEETLEKIRLSKDISEFAVYLDNEEMGVEYLENERQRIREKKLQKSSKKSTL